MSWQAASYVLVALTVLAVIACMSRSSFGRALYRCGHLTNDPASNAFSVFCYRQGKFLGAESVNKAQDHMAVRKLLGAGITLTPEQAADPAFDLRAAGAQAGR